MQQTLEALELLGHRQGRGSSRAGTAATTAHLLDFAVQQVLHAGRVLDVGESLLPVFATRLDEQVAGTEHALGLARAATRKPVLLAAAAAALLVLKPTRALRYITRGAMAVSLLRRVLGWMDRDPR